MPTSASTFDMDDSVVPRSSKQAKMLGVGIDAGPSVFNSRSHSPAAPTTGRSLPPLRTINTAQPNSSYLAAPNDGLPKLHTPASAASSSYATPMGPGSDMLSDTWNGWGAKLAASSSQGSDNKFPSSPRAEGTSSRNESKSYAMSSQSLRVNQNPGLSRTDSVGSSSTPRKFDMGSASKEKKKGLFGGFLKRKVSRSQFTGETESMTMPPEAASFDNVALPPKLQARGDAMDTLSRTAAYGNLGTPDSSKRQITRNRNGRRGNSPPRPGTTTSVGRQASVFSADPSISLDTDLNNLDGIVNPSAISSPTPLHRSPSLASSFDAGMGAAAASPTMNQGRRPSAGMPLLMRRMSNERGLGLSGGSGPETLNLSSLGVNAGMSGFRTNGSLSGASGPASFWSNGASQPSGTVSPMSEVPPNNLSLPVTAARAMLSRPSFVRSSSGLSTRTHTGGNGDVGSNGGPRSVGSGRRPSIAVGQTNDPFAPGALASTPTPTTSNTTSTAQTGPGAWTAPDSWAVKAEMGGMDHDDTSSDEEDEDDDEDNRIEEIESDSAMSPESKPAKVFGYDESGGLRPPTAGGRPVTRGGRPGTSDGMGGRMAASKSVSSVVMRSIRTSCADVFDLPMQFMMRITRENSTFSTLPVPLTVTAGELTATLARRFQISHAKTAYALYLREKGYERRVGANEKPMLLQKRRFEQAGYTELDKLEELGREDNAYLCKFIYKPAHPSIAAGEEDVNETNLEFVDLSGRPVETIPIYLYRHAHEIVSLNLSKNRPFDLPTDFVQLCTSLRELVLSHMGIKRIPQAVKECYSLTRLDISNNHIVDLEHIALEEVGELMSLKCHNNRLWTLPDYFARFTQLKYLNLSNNRFDSIPAVVTEISSLVELDISFNTVSAVPPEIGQLKNLERLVLLANTINPLPTTLTNLVHLKELDCRRNFIADLSPIASVAQLEVLRCEHNQASALDATWSQMRILSASNNSLTRFGLAGTGRSLTSLNLSFAKLSTLATDMFDHLGSVETLIFDSNQLRVLPDGIGGLSNLVHLSIKNNILGLLPDNLGRLQRLQTLQVSGNNLQTLPSSIWMCGQLTSLNASSNLMHDFPDPPLSVATATQAMLTSEGGLEELEARKGSTVSKAPSTSSGRIASPLALSLQKLYLGDNTLGDDVFAPISLMTELRVLNVSHNDILEIPPSSLFKLQQLEELYLSGNKMTSLPPDDLERLHNLKLLYLNGNKLQTLPAELGKIKKLFALDVGNNALKYNVVNWPYDWNWNWNLELRFLNLSGNKRLEIKPGHQNDDPSVPRNAKRRNLADFSALTKLHILGLMDVTLMIPSVPDESEDRRVRTSLSEINDMGYGIADTLGQRLETLTLVDIVIPRFRSKDDEAIFGLFDAVNKGQNTGAKLVKYLQDYFTAIFTLELSRLKSGEVTSDALRRAFLGINRDYGNMLLPTLETRRKDSEISLTDRSQASARTGAAGIIVYIRRKRVYVANAGNALAVIAGRGGTSRFISKRHEPFEPAEVARIRTAEGWISHRGYVNDEVDISRSFGFYNVFPAINASPNIEEFELADTDEFIIIANRGLWEHMSYQMAVDVARTERADPMAAAAKLRDLAISYGSSNNIMVMVLAVGDLFSKTKKNYRGVQRGVAMANDDEGFYGAHRTGQALRRGKQEEAAGERYLNLLDREVAPPVGMVALVFTDIRNSTALWESNPGMQTAIRMHNQLFRRQLRAIGGYEVKTEGDAFMISFPTVTGALLFCLTVQLELLREDWPQEILDSEEGKEITDSKGETIYRGLSVRMGIHWGQPVCEADPITRRMDYFGPVVNRAARIASIAEGGQISASQDVIDIIQDVVMEMKPEPSSLDSDSGSSPDEEEWIDPNEKQDILALRRLGFGISELGERRLKGLEAPELVSLIWPKALKERIKLSGDKDEQQQTEVFDPSSQVLDVSVVKGFGRVTHRLEAVAAALVHPKRKDGQGDHPTELAVANRQAPIFPASLAYPIRPDAADEELAALLEGYLMRIENVLSTLVLHQLGPFTEILAALGSAIKTDPRSIMLALSRYAAIMHSLPPTIMNSPPSPSSSSPAVVTNTL
ncbi:BZ3500_MvSof-1268-A1-R1_Chr9g10878 [Microbotryum saponariae]|uniref:Adenylate cyclase n=1 Tax=Microbotryum saponariae TaxID=289078 RepID=A0A2X0L5P7_9BASI|nr:BZ3501_MvSof-1269-A2-R1_Chr9g10626 [Microbotryum saponariae]SDA00849.1 BZ3500_MvSof-1268-A1-R1_Chr9g10878 [Microbotryum saponariae]